MESNNGIRSTDPVYYDEVRLVRTRSIKFYHNMKYYPKIRSSRKVDQAAYGSDYGFKY
ncbi:MAG: hypothetical protein WCE25_01840 [Nitrososphaeraceae archaeon]